MLSGSGAVGLIEDAIVKRASIVADGTPIACRVFMPQVAQADVAQRVGQKLA